MIGKPYGEEQQPPTTGTTNSEEPNSNTQQGVGKSSPDTQQDRQSYPSYVSGTIGVAIVFSLLAFVFIMWTFKDAWIAFEEPAFFITALNTLIAIFGILIVAYLGINATNNVAQSEIERANKEAEQWKDIADKALAALNNLSPEEAEKIRGQKPRR